MSGHKEENKSESEVEISEAGELNIGKGVT